MSGWDRSSEGVARTIQGLVQSADLVADAMERKWGVGRLRMLVGDELRERFDRQWAKWQDAYAAQDIDATRRHTEAMRRAWAALDAAAEAAGHEPLRPETWEARMPDGAVLTIVRTIAEAHAIGPDTTERRVWTLDEIARVLHAWEGLRWVDAARASFPGARVDALRLTPRGAESDPPGDGPIPFGWDFDDTCARTPLAGISAHAGFA
jgi:hypothetical protein